MKDEPFLPEWFWDEPPEATPPKAEPPDVVEHVTTIDYTWGASGALRPDTMFLTPALWQDFKNMVAQYQGSLNNIAGSLKNVAALYQGGFTSSELVKFDSILPNLELSGFQVHDEVQVTTSGAAGNSKGTYQMSTPLTDQELKLRIVKGRSSPKTITLPKTAPIVFSSPPSLDPSDKFVDAIVAGLKAVRSSVVEATPTQRTPHEPAHPHAQQRPPSARDRGPGS